MPLSPIYHSRTVGESEMTMSHRNLQLKKQRSAGHGRGARAGVKAVRPTVYIVPLATPVRMHFLAASFRDEVQARCAHLRCEKLSQLHRSRKHKTCTRCVRLRDCGEGRASRVLRMSISSWSRWRFERRGRKYSRHDSPPDHHFQTKNDLAAQLRGRSDYDS